MIVLSLFMTFMFIGAVSFGGGYAMLPLFERMVVDTHGWLTRSLFIDMIALSQVTPGPIAINSATFIGFQLIGVGGAAAATLGVVTIPVILVGFASKYFEEFKESKIVKGIYTGLRPAFAGLVLSSAASIVTDAIIDWWAMALFAVLMALLWVVKLHPILVIAVSGIAGFLIYA